MGIGMAKEQGEFVHVYDEKNHMLFSKSGKLYGFTSTTVTVKQGDWLHMFDEKGHHTGSRHA